MLRATQQDVLACHLLKLEQRLKAYEKLHANELAEMWHTLNVCKQAIADIASADEPVDPEGFDDAEADACSLDGATTDSRS
jgi:hypothetical protein